MKNLLTLMLCLFSSFALFGQIPQAFNYQATVRNLDGEIQYEIAADFEIEILQNGNSIYSEQHLDLNTGLTGVVNFKVGDGTNPSSDFSEVDWSIGGLQIRVNLNGEEMGVADIVAVPFALYAQNSGDSYWNETDSTLYYLDKNVGIGTNTPAIKLHTNVGPLASIVARFESENTNGATIDFRDPNTTGDWLARIGGKGDGLTFIAGGYERVFIQNNGYTGIGTGTPVRLFHARGGQGTSIVARIESQNVNGSTIDFRDPNTTGDWLARIGGKGDGLTFIAGGYERMSISDNGNIGIGTTTPEQKLDVNGRIRTKTLEITGGSDINEDFDSSVELKPGDVVIIDEHNEGQLCHTATEYDRKLAGVISGANGVNPGLSLSQEDVLEGEYPLAMLGRVYVKVAGSVSAGDMLTTSTKPRFAMAVKDYDRSRGAVIGKALTSNEGKEGLVLVLIQPQ